MPFNFSPYKKHREAKQTNEVLNVRNKKTPQLCQANKPIKQPKRRPRGKRQQQRVYARCGANRARRSEVQASKEALRLVVKNQK
jgi:hypothetical protein